MAARVIDVLTPEGRRFERILQELADKEVAVGFQHGDATEEDGTDICDIAAWNELGTEHGTWIIPSRPFLRKSVDENEDKIDALINTSAVDLMNGKTAEQILKRIGVFQQGLIKEKITEGDFAENAESTIRKKGSAHPLIDKGNMKNSVNYWIRQKGSGGD